MDELQTHEISQRFTSSETKYVIGKVKLANLLSAKLNERTDVFIAKA